MKISLLIGLAIFTVLCLWLISRMDGDALVKEWRAGSDKPLLPVENVTATSDTGFGTITYHNITIAGVAINGETGEVTLPKDKKLPEVATEFWAALNAAFPAFMRGIPASKAQPVTPGVIKILESAIDAHHTAMLYWVIQRPELLQDEALAVKNAKNHRDEVTKIEALLAKLKKENK